MHLALATNMLAAGNYDAAEKELAIIERTFASGPAAEKSKETRLKITIAPSP
jgi:hypothetical protein